MQQFNRLGKDYGKFVEEDPMRQSLHYPAVVSQLASTGTAENIRRILDVGCGDGQLARILAADPYNYKMSGYDSSPDFIEQARKLEQETPMGITYYVAQAHEFVTTDQFDDAVSVMVLPYAPDAAYLQYFFRSAYRSLVSGGRMISVIFNPAFTAFDTVIGNRRFVREAVGIQVQFLHPETKEVVFTSHLTQFSQAQYQQGATDGGFRTIEWKNLYPTNEAVKTLGADFWKICEEEQPYAMIVAS